ncbi:MAG: PQQ-binding-like beta-propeller repeat protein [candidate division KSB1 bacterium]|nr:PQQ-binding-like beta-propeller repeat protein [candidate division KSB1 bacterium]
MRSVVSQTRRAASAFLFALVGSAFLGSGCGPTRLAVEEDQSRTWPMYLGETSRICLSPWSLSPPLETLWRRSLTAGISEGIARRGDVLAVPTTRGEIQFLTAARGKTIGKLKLPKTSTTLVWPAPTRILILSRLGRGNLRCYDLREGRWLWQFSAGPVDTEPVVLADTLYVVSTYGRARAILAATGRQVWEVEVPSQVHSSPCVAGHVLAFGTDRGEVIALRRTDGTVVWRTRFRASVLATPVTYDSLILVGATDSVFRALAVEDGRIVWERRAGGRIVRPAAVNPSQRAVIYAANDHSVTCARLEDGQTLWRTELQAPASTAPAVAGETIWVGGLDRRLYGLDATTGSILWSDRLKGTPKVLIPAEDRLFVATEDYHLYCFRSHEVTTP